MFKTTVEFFFQKNQCISMYKCKSNIIKQKKIVHLNQNPQTFLKWVKIYFLDFWQKESAVIMTMLESNLKKTIITFLRYL